MDATRERLRSTIADFFGVDPVGIGPSFSLSGRRGEGSIARAALDAAIRRQVGKKSAAVYTASTLGQIEAELFPDGPRQVAVPDAEPSDPAAPPSMSLVSGGVSAGIDIESVAGLPEADDYWEHTFFRSTFTPAEIAYCVARSSPRPHFAARWCAKEALRKCDRAFLDVPLDSIEVVRDGAGAPTFRRLVGREWRPLPHALSLSHTDDTAVAVVIALAQTPSPSPPVEVPAPVAEAPAPPARRGAGRLLEVAILLAALVMAAMALYRTYPHG